MDLVQDSREALERLEGAVVALNGERVSKVEEVGQVQCLLNICPFTDEILANIHRLVVEFDGGRLASRVVRVETANDVEAFSDAEDEILGISDES